MADGTTLTTREAATYVRSSYGQFLREVAAGVWSPPIAPNSRPMKFSKMQLDKDLAGEPLHAATSRPATDELMERIRGLR